MSRVALLSAFVFTPGCDQAQQVHSPNPTPVSVTEVGSTDVYLPAEQTGGVPYCLNPASARLRASVPRFRIADTDELDRDALAQDLRFFAHLLAKVYAGYPELSQRHDLAIGDFFAEWANDLTEQPGTISFAQGVVAGFTRLARWHRDRHLAPVGGTIGLHERPELAIHEFIGPGPASSVMLEQCHVEIEQAEGPSPQIVPGTLRRAQQARLPNRIEPVVAVSALGDAPEALTLLCPSSQHRLKRQARATFEDNQGPSYSFRTVGDTALIRIRRFHGNPADIELLQQLHKQYAAHTTSRRIVFDVRGNGGGDDSYLFKWLFQAKAGPWAQGVSIDFRAGLGGCGSWNALVVDQLLSQELDSQDATSRRRALLAKIKIESADMNVLEVDSGLRESEAKSSFAGPIFVLIDRGTASSGESVPHYLGLALAAHVVGERSAGFMDYGNIVPFMLPQTGLWVQVPTTRFYNPKPVEMVGVEVETYLSSDLMALPAEKLLTILDAIEEASPNPESPHQD